MYTNTITAQQVADIVLTLPPDLLVSVYDFVLFVKQHPLAPEPESDVFGETPEEIRADEEQWDRKYAASRDQLRAMAREAAAEYRAGRTKPMEFTSSAPGLDEGVRMLRPVSVRALPGYKLWVKYSDGIEGQADLSYLVGKGVFALWNDYNAFQKVYIGEHGEIAWSEEVDLCPDSMYMKITNRTPEELFPSLRAEPDYA